METDMTTINEQTNISEGIRVLEDDEINNAAGAAANCGNGRVLFDLGWIGAYVIECDDGSVGVGTFIRERS
jgi:hypothetical protein